MAVGNYTKRRFQEKRSILCNDAVNTKEEVENSSSVYREHRNESDGTNTTNHTDIDSSTDRKGVLVLFQKSNKWLSIK